MAEAALLDSRAVIRVGGPDARTFLQGLITQEPPSPNEAAFAALLTPQGKILFDFLMFGDGDGFLLDCRKESADALAKRLSLYRLRAKATIEPLPWSVAAVWDSDPPGARGIAFRDPRLLALGQRLLAPKADFVAQPFASEALWNQHRIGLGVPEFGSDFASEEVFLLDVNYDALSGVNYKKGCFVGQEVTSRMKRKGEVRKRTLVISFEGAPPPKGTPVVAGDATLGEVMSGIEGAALALLRVDRLASAGGALLEAGGKALRVDVPAYLEGG